MFRILDSALREVTSTPMTLSADQFADSNGAGATFTVPLDTIKPGAYVLRLDASIGGATGRRKLRFAVK
jgi:hypothetical protein